MNRTAGIILACYLPNNAIVFRKDLSAVNYSLVPGMDVPEVTVVPEVSKVSKV